MSGYSIELGALRIGASQLLLESEPEGLDLDPKAWSGSIVGQMLSERNGDRITVRGKVTAVALLECVRCLEEFIKPVEVSLDVFAERTGTASRADEEQLELDESMVFHDGKSLDLRRQVREALLLELPIAPHCREDCLGLCLRCGADLNQGLCGCDGRDPGP